MPEIKLLEGNVHIDGRGSLKFFNNFDMGEVVRMYEISPLDTVQIRAWQGHKQEHKWFYCLAGSFAINLIQLDNFERPSATLTPIKIMLTTSVPNVLSVPGGYASGIKALEEGSKVLVFSNFSVEASIKDDYRFAPEFWSADW